MLKKGIFRSREEISIPLRAKLENSLGISLPKMVLPPLIRKANPLNIVSVPSVATKGSIPIIETKKNT